MISKQKIKIILIVFCLFSASPIFSQGVNYYGTSVANFLKIGMDTKNAGLADAEITMSRDASSMFWNPATISRNPHMSASCSYSKWLVDSYLSYFAFSMPTEFGTLGLDISYFGSGDMEETTLQKQDGTGRNITANDISIGLAYSRGLTDRFSFGVKVKYINEQLASVEASALAFDIGTVFETSFLNNMKLGISLSNFGSSLQFSGNDLIISHVVPGSPTNKEIPAVLQTDSWNLPLLFRIGATTDIVSSDKFRWTACYTLTDARDYQVRHNIGSEITFLNMVAVRGGYKINYDETKYSVGVGLKVASELFGDAMIDYAFTDFGRLKNVHKMSVSINF